MGIGVPEVLIILVLWVIPAVLVLFGIYWAIRLAIRHETRRSRHPYRNGPRP